MVSVMILDVGQTCDLKPTHRNHIQNIPKPYQNHTKTVSKSYQKRINIVSKSHQNHIKIIPKPYKSSKHRPKTYPCAVSVSFFEANSLEPYQNRIKIISKSYQNRIKIVSKPYQNHIEIITPNSKHIKFISSNRIQNHIKIVKQIFPEFSILEGFRSANFRCAVPNGKSPGWWFGTWLLFFHMLGIRIPTDFHIFQMG